MKAMYFASVLCRILYELIDNISQHFSLSCIHLECQLNVFFHYVSNHRPIPNIWCAMETTKTLFAPFSANRIKLSFFCHSYVKKCFFSDDRNNVT